MAHDHKKLTRVGQAQSVTVATLAAKTALALQGTVVTQNFAAALYQGSMSLRGGTEGEVLALYVASADLSQAEVEEAIESTPLHSRDVPATEHTARNVQLLGIISLSDPLHLDMGNRLAMYRENVGWDFWAYNPSAAAMTTGGVLAGQLWVYGRWKD